MKWYGIPEGPNASAAFFWLFESVVCSINFSFPAHIVDSDLYELIVRIVSTFLIALWVMDDSRFRGKPISPKMQIALVIFEIAVPYYIIRTRGIKGFLKWIGLVLVFISSIFLLSFAISSLAGQFLWA